MTAAAAPTRTNTISTPALVHSVELTGPAGRLEAVLNEGAPDAPFAALICHPHPKGGGTMHNKVVYHAMKVMNDPAWGLALPVLRFNFRGTGLSQGIHDGKVESEDVLAAMGWLENEYKLPLVVAGFSFGAAMALKATTQSRRRFTPLWRSVCLPRRKAGSPATGLRRWGAKAGIINIDFLPAAKSPNSFLAETTTSSRLLPSWRKWPPPPPIQNNCC